MPDLLADFQPWDAAEIKYNAREEFLRDWWERPEWFMEEMRTNACEENVLPLLRLSLFYAKSHPELSLAYAKRARSAMEEQASFMVPDEYLRQARDEYIGEQETERKWNGVGA